MTGPHIILLPKSVLGNWQLEFKRFCPSVRVLRLSGTKVSPRPHLRHVTSSCYVPLSFPSRPMIRGSANDSLMRPVVD